MEETWWQYSENEIGQIEAADNFWEALYGREIDGEWEYAITRWHYGNPALVLSFKSGKVTGGTEGR